ncbi:lytic transglycosylase domain-containing protein [Thermocrinis minervae]|uniref:Transglycosylase SLT domain-containing protein n=1 Tax=Thermocrinis minervae TaxID=381751 RepID=A0A1M6R6F8_9AQUI|nr:lytic transglycosylase domain-containing protein [Thermocrinis minervae]SHK28042.1 Transglycosylase SLT domain-containing protein [Thermocrinis minervae]
MRIEDELPLKVTRDKHIASKPQEDFQSILSETIQSLPNNLTLEDRIRVKVSEVSAKYSIPPNILLAMIKKESNFNPSAYNRNKDGTQDIGLMQVNYEHNRSLMQEYGIKDPKQLYDVELNIELGARILYENYKRYKSWPLAIKAYNGISADNWDYVKSVLELANKLRW